MAWWSRVLLQRTRGFLAPMLDVSQLPTTPALGALLLAPVGNCTHVYRPYTRIHTNKNSFKSECRSLNQCLFAVVLRERFIFKTKFSSPTFIRIYRILMKMGREKLWMASSAFQMFTSSINKGICHKQ